MLILFFFFGLPQNKNATLKSVAFFMINLWLSDYRLRAK